MLFLAHVAIRARCLPTCVPAVFLAPRWKACAARHRLLQKIFPGSVPRVMAGHRISAAVAAMSQEKLPAGRTDRVETVLPVSSRPIAHWSRRPLAHPFDIHLCCRDAALRRSVKIAAIWLAWPTVDPQFHRETAFRRAPCGFGPTGIAPLR